MPRLIKHVFRHVLLITTFVTLAAPVAAQDKVTFTTSWFAQAEHGGYYQAVAKGIYKKHGLDVAIKMGGPQVNIVQLLAAGQTDFIMGKDFQVLSGLEKGIPMVTVAANFQYEVQGIMTHPDINSIAELKGRSIMIAGSAHTSYWPMLKSKFGFTDAQVRPYTGSLQPFFVDTSMATQGFITSEPFEAEKAGVKSNFYLLSEEGYPPYGNTIVTMQKTLKERPDVTARFVKATLEGWASYLQDPAAGNELIRKDNPQMSDEKLVFAVAGLRKLNVMGSGDAAKLGVGAMTEARWKKTFDFMVANALLKPDVDWKQAYTLAFCRRFGCKYPASGIDHIIYNCATPIDDENMMLVQWLYRNDSEEACSTQELIDWDAAITAEDRDILEATDPDACVDTRRRVEFHMPSDKPGLLIRKQLMDLLTEHGESEVFRT